MISNFSILPIPWDEVIPRLLARRIFPNRPLSEGELAHGQRATEMWMISLHWLIQKEWDDKHKIPASNQRISVLRSRGVVLQQVLRLCERCQTLKGHLAKNSVPYAHTSQWFEAVFYDLLDHSFITDSLSARLSTSKQGILAKPRNEVARLRKLENPCNQKFQHLHALIETGIALSKQSVPFEKNYWKPFCDSLSAYNTARDSSKWQRVVHEGGEAYIHSSGRGKGRRRLEPLRYEGFES